MEQKPSFTDFLRGLKNRRLKDLPSQKSLIQNKRLEKCDQLRATMRTFSPLPPTPLHTAVCKETLKSSNKIESTASKSNQPSTSSKSAIKKVVKRLENDLMADTTTKAEQQRVAAMERLQRAKKWRELRQKQLAEKKATEKPPFIVSRYVHLPPVPTFERPLAKSNHTFKLPVNIKPIHFENNTKKVTNTRNVLNIQDKPKGTTKSMRSKVQQSTTQKKQALNDNQRVTRASSRKLFTQSYDPGIQTTISIDEKKEEVQRKTDNETPKTPKSVKMTKPRSGTPGRALKEKNLNFSDDFESNNEDTTQKTEDFSSQSGKTPKRKSRTSKIQKNNDTFDVLPGNEENTAAAAADLSATTPDNKTPFKNTNKTLKSTKKTPKSAKTPKRKSRVSAIPQNGDFSNEMEANKENQEEDGDGAYQNVITPENKPDLAMNYVSPFVTMSRGKRRARDEFALRSANGGELLTSPEATGTKAGSAYFYKLLDNEITRIRKLCADWEEYKVRNFFKIL
jgi:hypothetical protein